MGLFDSKSTANNVSQNAGFSEVDGPVTSAIVQGGGKGSTTAVSLTDGGAIKDSLSLASQLSLASLDFARQTQAGGAAALNDSVKASYALANSARQSETSGAINNFLKYGAIVVGLAIAAYALTRG
jgi:hypothetical protein